jgi:large subunit ribosomal protein L13
MVNRITHKIDATDKAIGRISTEIALLLRGKDKLSFRSNIDVGDIVEVSNYRKIKMTGRKGEQKIYFKHSGYPGGLKETKMGTKLVEDPKFLIENAVYHMLPRNKLRPGMFKRLKFVE